MVQIAMIAASSRPNTVRRTFLQVTEHAGLRRLVESGRIPKPWVYYAKRYHEVTPDYIKTSDVWEVTEVLRARPFITNFYQMFQRANPAHDFVFMEDDLAPCLNAVERIVSEPVPIWAGVLSFFDYRNEFPRPGVYPHPGPREFWGSQCLKFSSRDMAELKGMAKPGALIFSDGTDVWSGIAAAKLGKGVAQYSPSIVQHIGMLSAYSPGRDRPVANNFPGERFDAMGDSADPVLPGSWEGVTESLWCPLHRKNHEPKDFGRCPGIVSAPDVRKEG